MRKLIILTSLLLFCFGVATKHAMAENASHVAQGQSNMGSLGAAEVSLQSPLAAKGASPFQCVSGGIGLLNGCMYQVPSTQWNVATINARVYMQGNMGYLGQGNALALSFLKGTPFYDNSCAQQFSGIYPGLYGRKDWFIWSKFNANCQPEYTIYARTTMRARDDIPLFGGTQDFNLGGHGRPVPTDRRVCYAGLNLSNGQMYDCTTPSSPLDDAIADPVTWNFPDQFPAYDYDDAPYMWEWLIMDHAYSNLNKSLYYMAYLPVPLSWNGDRVTDGFTYYYTNNYWSGFTINYLPYSGTNCTPQTRSGRAYVRSRVFMVEDVPYHDSLRANSNPPEPGDIVDNPGVDTLDIVIVAKEMISFEVEQSVSPSYFADEIFLLGGGMMTEVYAFAIDPENPNRSLFLASMNRYSTTCSVSPPTAVSPSTCDGRYQSLVPTQMIQHKYYWRRPEEALSQNVVLDTTGAYHQIVCQY
jgi:hypothetical protein